MTRREALKKARAAGRREVRKAVRAVLREIRLEAEAWRAENPINAVPDYASGLLGAAFDVETVVGWR